MNVSFSISYTSFCVELKFVENFISPAPFFFKNLQIQENRFVRFYAK